MTGNISYALRPVAAIVLAFALLAATAARFAGPAVAGSGYNTGAKRLVRIGLNKSVVVRLPVAARDVLVGNPAITEVVVRTQNVAYLFAKKIGQTNAFFFDAQGRQILNLDIEVSVDMTALSKLIRRTLPGTGITVDTIGDNVVLGGSAANASQAKIATDLAAKFTGDAKKVISTIAIAGREQVMLKVRVAEVQRTVLKQFGIDANTLIKAGNATIGLTSSNPFALNGLLSNTAATFTGKNTSAVLRAMENDGLLRTLAEPTLTAISGESAKFLAGGEFPIPVSQDAGQVAVEFKPFGVGLGFTPVVLSGGRISLRISTEVSEITSENQVTTGSFIIPSLKVRRAETTVELPSGGSLAMAGLIQESTKQQVAGIPGIKNLPILGTLFRSRDFQSSLTELVIIVTPYIVNPVNEKQLVTPIDRLATPTDTQTILFGRLNKVYGAAGTRPKGVYHGNVGFIVE